MKNIKLIAIAIAAFAVFAPAAQASIQTTPPAPLAARAFFAPSGWTANGNAYIYNPNAMAIRANYLITVQNGDGTLSTYTRAAIVYAGCTFTDLADGATVVSMTWVSWSFV